MVSSIKYLYEDRFLYKKNLIFLKKTALLSHNAVIAPLHLFDLKSTTPFIWAFNLTDATYLTRSTCSNGAVLERRMFASRRRRNVLVQTMQLVSGSSCSLSDVSFFVNPTTFDFNAAPDFNYKTVNFSKNNLLSFVAQTKLGETKNSRETIGAVRMTDIPRVLQPNTVATVIVAVSATTEHVTAADVVSRSSQMASRAIHDVPTLLGEQETAWFTLHQSFGIELDRRASLQLKTAVLSSKVYLLSSIRADYNYSISPGGITVF